MKTSVIFRPRRMVSIGSCNLNVYFMSSASLSPTIQSISPFGPAMQPFTDIFTCSLNFLILYFTLIRFLSLKRVLTLTLSFGMVYYKRREPFSVDREVLSLIFNNANSYSDIEDKRARIAKKAAYLPMQMKSIQHWLNQKIAEYEKIFGQIPSPEEVESRARRHPQQ